MPSKDYGRAAYKAFRSGGFLHIIATGETPNLTDQAVLEQLPFRIFPPMFGLFFITQDVSLPALRPFTVELQTLFPAEATTVRVQDADGDHAVPIADLGAAPLPAAPDTGNDFCVYQWIGINPYMIAKCDAIVPAVYSRVFGPGTRAACDQYIREHGGV